MKGVSVLLYTSPDIMKGNDQALVLVIFGASTAGRRCRYPLSEIKRLRGRLPDKVISRHKRRRSKRVEHYLHVAAWEVVREEVNPRDTSKLCPVCGRIGRRRAGGRIVVCGCGYKGDRDLTAAFNIVLRVATGAAVRPECGASKLGGYQVLCLRFELLRRLKWRVDPACFSLNIA